MTKKLEALFDLPSSDELESEKQSLDIDETKIALAEIDDAIDKIDAALPMVRDLQASDAEMDDLAKKATESFNELMSLGMNVDSRFAAEIFSAAAFAASEAFCAAVATLPLAFAIFVHASPPYVLRDLCDLRFFLLR